MERVPGADVVEFLRLSVRLAPGAPAGLVSDYLSLRFDDSRTSQIDILVQGESAGRASCESPNHAGLKP